MSALRLIWFRRDLRLTDNPIWSAGDRGGACPVFVLDPTLLAGASEARRNHLFAGMAELDRRLQERGGRLRVETGDPVRVIPALAAQLDADEVHVNEDASPYGRRRDGAVAKRVRLVEHAGNYVQPLGAARAGKPYRVFSAFLETWSRLPLPAPRSEPDLDLTDEPGIGLPDHPGHREAGEIGALERLARFDRIADGYADDKDRLDRDATSRLSVDLKFGWLGAAHAARVVGTGSPGRAEWTRQLAWRDFFANLLVGSPAMLDQTLRPSMQCLSWRDDPADLEAWIAGTTGFPLVDAGMRQLRAEGWMPNRVRMVAASFLVKHLLIDWRLGERHFRKHLLDADPAQNSGNWQWVAGTGHAAAPWFRVLNPTVQGQKFDPAGSYVRRWVPELADVAAPAVHRPGADRLVDGYPAPIVDHDLATDRYAAAVRDAVKRYQSEGSPRRGRSGGQYWGSSGIDSAGTAYTTTLPS